MPSRREFLQRSGMGLGALGLAGLIGDSIVGAAFAGEGGGGPFIMHRRARRGMARQCAGAVSVCLRYHEQRWT